MNLNDYQLKTSVTAIYPSTELAFLGASGNVYDQRPSEFIYPALGLVEEAGEVAGKIKKWIRDGTDYHELRASVKKELGDVLWYAAQVASTFALTLDEVAEANLDKLKSRQERGVLNGSGDNR